MSNLYILTCLLITIIPDAPQEAPPTCPPCTYDNTGPVVGGAVVAVIAVIAIVVGVVLVTYLILRHKREEGT